MEMARSETDAALQGALATVQSQAGPAWGGFYTIRVVRGVLTQEHTRGFKWTNFDISSLGGNNIFWVANSANIPKYTPQCRHFGRETPDDIYK